MAERRGYQPLHLAAAGEGCSAAQGGAAVGCGTAGALYNSLPALVGCAPQPQHLRAVAAAAGLSLRHCCAVQGKGPRCHFFSTFFANKLYKDGGYNYEQVQAGWGQTAGSATCSPGCIAVWQRWRLLLPQSCLCPCRRLLILLLLLCPACLHCRCGGGRCPSAWPAAVRPAAAS